jgi:hypothetical protein
MHPASNRERAPPQRLTHPRGKTLDVPQFRVHPSQLAATSQRGPQNDEIVVITQIRLEPFQAGNEGSDAGGERLREAQLIPERFHFLAPAMQRCRLSGCTSPFHRLAAPAVRIGKDRNHVGHSD